MKHFKRLLQVTLVSITSLSACGINPPPPPSQLAGVIDGNNAGLGGSADSTWFIGDKPVEYCIQSSPSFRLDRDNLSILVKNTIASWQTFLEDYQLDLRTVGDFEVGQAQLAMAKKFIEIPSCDHPTEQIAFLFGVKNDFLDKNSLQIENALGTALRYPYNMITHRTGGVVWIQEHFVDELHLKHILLHEFGHVLGMPHDSVHVMHKDIARLLSSEQGDLNQELVKENLGKIESEGWKFGIRKNGQKINLSSGHMCGKKLGWQDVTTHSITSLLPPGAVNSECYRLSLAFEHFGMRDTTFTIHIETSAGQRLAIPASFQMLLGNTAMGPSVYGTFAGSKRLETRYFAKAGQEEWFGIDGTLNGYIKIGETKYAATLKSGHGLSLSVFNPTLGEWITEEEGLYRSLYWNDLLLGAGRLTEVFNHQK